jgi:RNA polymerase sigma factor (sigma-70 family)
MRITPPVVLKTRQSLIGRLKNLDDQSSWQQFFDLYWRLIYGTARKAGLSDAESQDVVQETILTVTKKIQSFEVNPDRGSFRSWLMNITRWRITDQFRKRAPDYGGSGDPPRDTSRTSSTARIPDPASLVQEAIWEKDWQENLMETALDRVQQRVRPTVFQLFHLHVTKEVPARQVADKFGVKVAQVYFAKYQVTTQLKREIRKLQKLSPV